MKSATYDLINESDAPLTIYRVTLEGPILSMVMHGSETRVAPGDAFVLEVNGRVALTERDLAGCAITLHTDMADMPVVSFPLSEAHNSLGPSSAPELCPPEPVNPGTSAEAETQTDTVKTLYPYLDNAASRAMMDEFRSHMSAPSVAEREDDVLLLTEPQPHREPTPRRTRTKSGTEVVLNIPRVKTRRVKRPRSALRRVVMAVGAGFLTHYGALGIFGGLT